MDNEYKVLKNIFKAFSITLIIFAIFLSCATTDFTFQKIDDGTAIKITGIKAREIEALEIPSVINGLPVTVIGEDAFRYKKINQLILAPTIVSIEKYAFMGNQIQEIVLPDALTKIGEYAFSRNKIEALIIPENVITIEERAFYQNKLERLVIPETITKIGQGAFSNNQLTEVAIPASISIIEYGTFSINKLTNIIIPKNITQIQSGAFGENNIMEIIIGENVAIQNNSFDGNFSSFYTSNGQKAGTYIFHNNRWRSGTLEEYQSRYGATTEQEFGKILEPYIGYYFLAWSPPNLNNTAIVKLSLQDDLYMQRITIENNELIEGEKILLNDIDDDLLDDYPSLKFKNDTGRYTVYIDQFDTQYEDIDINFNYRNSYRLSLDPLFTKNINEVLELYKLYFTEEAQKRYSGNFIFSEYEIIQNTTGNPFDEDVYINKEIFIGYEDGALFFNNSYYSFIVHNAEKVIFSNPGDGTLTSSTQVFRFQDENTIIENSSYDSWTDDDSGWSETLKYRVIYKRAL